LDDKMKSSTNKSWKVPHHKYFKIFLYKYGNKDIYNMNLVS
jgi:hypothetical protein